MEVSGQFYAMAALPPGEEPWLFIRLLKKKDIGGIGFRFVPLDSPMFVVSVTLFTFLQAM